MENKNHAKRVYMIKVGNMYVKKNKNFAFINPSNLEFTAYEHDESILRFTTDDGLDERQKKSILSHMLKSAKAVAEMMETDDVKIAVKTIETSSGVMELDIFEEAVGERDGE